MSDSFDQPVTMEQAMEYARELQRELAMIEGEVAKVYFHITGGRISKCNTLASQVIAEADDLHTREAAEYQLSGEGWSTLDDLVDLARQSWEDFTRLDALEAELVELR